MKRYTSDVTKFERRRKGEFKSVLSANEESNLLSFLLILAEAALYALKTAAPIAIVKHLRLLKQDVSGEIRDSEDLYIKSRNEMELKRKNCDGRY